MPKIRPIDALTADLNNISKLPDEPNADAGLSADALKGEFDKAGNQIRDYINGTLLPQYVGNTEEFVLEHIAEMGGGDMLREVYDHDRSGAVEDAKRLGGRLPEDYATLEDLDAFTRPPRLLAEFWQSDEWICPPDVTKIGVWLVGGGAGGAFGTFVSSSSQQAGVGGNSGFCVPGEIEVTPGQSYQITIGAGGLGGTTNNSGGALTQPTVGGQTAAFGLTANGGAIGQRAQGWTTSGGSGAGAVGEESTSQQGGGDGGSNGANGLPAGGYRATGGTGQGTTTNPYNGKIYSGGGGGGGTVAGGICVRGRGGFAHVGKGGNSGLSSGTVKAENGAPGGGGGGGGSCTAVPGQHGGNGGSGLVEIYAMNS